MLMAGLDGIAAKTDPGPPLDKNIYELPPGRGRAHREGPGSLDESLRALERDHDFLLRADVFTQDVIETWLEYKWKHEVDP